ncbi:AMP-dependent synthetase/ligase [Isoptericola sp. b441]|uniref:Acyl-CoA synthetase n=1 Tax=Actinotalea lenta TaxID=3064654 RepID=A0ABT9D8Q6_9CELL|nr:MULTISPECIES: AMP-dependent synthetase/ligase [unclassified Isoptericola]MDO8107279.1 AMP-dependent synthetase/ligase [Isoptericola sp. b441]MDO8121059.1 AMP-dependent synthetase/ligase [Isoptericola sp. b490]
MRTATSPSLIDPALPSIPGLLAARLERAPASTFCERKAELGGTWSAMTVRAFVDQVNAVARGLVARGVEPGDRVSIMARTRYEWTLLDFAIWAAGAIPVPVYETSSRDQIAWILGDAGVRLALVETPAHAEVTRAATAEVPVLVIDDGAVEALVAEGLHVPEAEIERRSGLAGSDDLATIIYTSGTTGRPKGVELTHGNFTSLSLEGATGLPEVVAHPGARTLLFMPLAHVFARYIQVMCVASGSVLGHTPDTKNLLSDLATFRPTFLLAVPRVFEKVYNSAEQTASASTLKLSIFRWSAKVAITYSRSMDTRPSLRQKLWLKVADALVLHRLRAALGGQARWAISGGAPLGDRLGHFYRGLGLHVLEGYGLTETTAPTAVNMPAKSKIGTVGPPFPGASIRIADDGEIEVSGAHVFRGYHNNPEATAVALVDGWFHTGDLGSLDEDGYLTITGRKKEIIVTAGGKNVAPAVLEDRLRGHPLVSQVVVVGDGKPFIAALVTLDAEMLPGWLAGHDLPDMTVAEAARSNAVLAALDRAVTRANQAVSRAESIRKIKVLDVDFTETNGYLTPSTKVKRARVLTDFAAEIESLYT